MVENDTWTETATGGSKQYNDGQKYFYLATSGLVGADMWNSGKIGGDSVVNYTVPSDLPADGTTEIGIDLYIGDSRLSGDARHDPDTNKYSWSFVIDSDYPADLSIVSDVDQEPRVPPGWSGGDYLATFQASNDAPSPRTSWAGTVVTEQVKPFAGNASDFISGWLSQPSEQGSSFAFDSNNQFTDAHKQDTFGVILMPAVSNSVYTAQQIFHGGSSKTYPFLITRTAVRQPNTGHGVGDDVKINETEAHQ